jgi:signal transduction histidine kinase/CheY-like chemotaxis protein
VSEARDSERILVLAPIGRDGELAARAVREAGLDAQVCADAHDLCAQIEAGAGAALLTEEALDASSMMALVQRISTQPPWSDFPLVVFSGLKAASGERPVDRLARLLNVTILDRPVHVRTAMSAISSALRSRRRQYEARRAIRQRDQFLAMLGHELRNPLGAIVLASYSLNERVGDDALVRKHYGVIERQTKHLTRLIDELLDVARITSGKVTLRRAPMDLGALIANCLQAHESATRASELTLALELPEEPIIVDGDPVRLEQIIANIVTNAIKYTPPGGRICVRLCATTAVAQVIVRDTGSGISPALLGRVFDLFAQAEDTLARSRGGLGIGLTVVRQLVELHGGTVTAKSDGIGGGSEFTVVLPRLLAADAPAAPPAVRVEIAPHRIVVLEDNDDVREGLRDLLARSGHSVTTAEDGNEGAALITRSAPDLAFIDIGLPGIDGYEVARRVRREIGARPVLVALTGYGQAEDRQRALAAGFNVHMTKPIDVGQLERVLGSAFAHEMA